MGLHHKRYILSTPLPPSCHDRIILPWGVGQMISFSRSLKKTETNQNIGGQNKGLSFDEQ